MNFTLASVSVLWIPQPELPRHCEKTPLVYPNSKKNPAIHPSRKLRKTIHSQNLQTKYDKTKMIGIYRNPSLFAPVVQQGFEGESQPSSRPIFFGIIAGAKELLPSTQPGGKELPKSSHFVSPSWRVRRWFFFFKERMDGIWIIWIWMWTM